MFSLSLCMMVIEAASFWQSWAGSQIIAGPSIQSASIGEVAVFNCSLQCTSETTILTWYIVLPATLRKVSISPYTSPSQLKSVYGLTVSRNVIDECSRGGYHVEQLLISNMTKDLDLMPIQCGLLCFPNVYGCKVAQVLFSPVGLLKAASKAAGTTVDFLSVSIPKARGN